MFRLHLSLHTHFNRNTKHHIFGNVLVLRSCESSAMRHYFQISSLFKNLHFTHGHQGCHNTSCTVRMQQRRSIMAHSKSKIKPKNGDFKSLTKKKNIQIKPSKEKYVNKKVSKQAFKNPPSNESPMNETRSKIAKHSPQEKTNKDQAKKTKIQSSKDESRVWKSESKHSSSTTRIQELTTTPRSIYLDTMDEIEKLNLNNTRKGPEDEANISKAIFQQHEDALHSGSKSKNWYPFHMSKARNDIRSRVVDTYIQLLDARCPFTSYNPSILTNNDGKSITNKNVTTICYKRDLGFIPNNVNQSNLILDTDLLWLDRFASRKEIASIISKIESSVNRRFKTIPVVSCVVGIPNVGKSSFINMIAQQNKAKKGDLPGVTKRISGFQVTDDLMILDTPGILMPRIESVDDKMKLMLINAVSEKVVDYVDLMKYGLSVLNRKGFTEGYMKEFGFKDPCYDAEEFLIHIARKHSFRTGDGYDSVRAAEMWVRKFRSGDFGKVFLDDFPHEVQYKRLEFLALPSFLKNISNLSDWNKLGIEHVYIDAQPFLLMTQYTCKLKLLKRHSEVQNLLVRITQKFAENCNVRRCNLLYSHVSASTLKSNKIDSQVLLRDIGTQVTVQENMLALANSFAESEEIRKRLFITNDEVLAKQLCAKNYRVAHMGEWLRWIQRVVFKEKTVENMVENFAIESKV